MADDPHGSALLTAIAEQEARIARIEDKRERARVRLAELRAAAATLGAGLASKTASPPHPQALGPLTPAKKVALFRQLFRDYARARCVGVREFLRKPADYATIVATVE